MENGKVYNMLKLILNRFIHSIINPRKGSYEIMEFGESVNAYLKEHPDISVDRDKLLKAFIDGKIDHDLKGIENFI